MLLTDWIFFLLQTRLHSSLFIFCLFFPITAFFFVFVFSFTFSNSFLLTLVFLLFFPFFSHCIVESFSVHFKTFPIFTSPNSHSISAKCPHHTKRDKTTRKKGKKDLASSNPGMQVVMPHPVSTYPYPHRQTDWWVGGGGVTKWRRTPTYHILTSHNSSCYL